MVKIAQMTFPPGYEELVNKILRWYDSLQYPTWAFSNKHNTRAAKKVLQEKTYLPGARDTWKGLSAVEKAAWKSAAAFDYRSNYALFCGDYSYRKKNGLSLPGTPDNLHQIYGLEMCDPDGLNEVIVQREDIVLAGPVSLSFNFKKDEISEPLAQSWGFDWTLYYFEDGENKIEYLNWEAPAGNLAWQNQSFTLGHAGQLYFHSVLTFYLEFYQANVFLDNLLISDATGDIYREAWKLNAKKQWIYTPQYRKTGWLFSPDYDTDFIKVLYLG